MDHKRLEKDVDALKRGEQAAFSYVYECTYKAVFLTAYRILGDKPTAEDVTQEVFVAALRKLDAYGGGNFCGWLVTMTKRLAINEYNKTSRKEIRVDFSENESLYGKYSIEDKLDTPMTELARRVLDEEEYQIVMLCAVAGYKRREVAAMLNLPIPTVTWKYNRAVEKLKRAHKEAER